jgi:hypothetical protein
MAKLNFQMAELNFEMAKLPFQMARLPFQMAELLFQMAKFPFQMPELPLQVTGQNDRQGKNLTGQLRILAGHCPLTGRYFVPWVQYN